MNGMWGSYSAKCKWPGCPGTVVYENHLSANHQVGDTIVYDANRPEKTRCPNCKRASLVVTSMPEKPKPPPPKGWTKIPTE